MAATSYVASSFAMTGLVLNAVHARRMTMLVWNLVGILRIVDRHDNDH